MTELQWQVINEITEAYLNNYKFVIITYYFYRHKVPRDLYIDTCNDRVLIKVYNAQFENIILIDTESRIILLCITLYGKLIPRR